MTHKQVEKEKDRRQLASLQLAFFICKILIFFVHDFDKKVNQSYSFLVALVLPFEGRLLHQTTLH